MMQKTGGQVIPDLSVFGCRVSRSHHNWPRIIPGYSRSRLGSDPKYIKLWLSLFSIYRILECTGKVNTSTITDSSEFVLDPSYLGLALSELVGTKRFDVFKDLKALPFPISKSSPTTSLVQGDSDIAVCSTNAENLIVSALVLRESNLYPIFQQYCLRTNNRWILRYVEFQSLGLKLSDLPRLVKSDPSFRINPNTYLGKLGLKQEPAGKVRIFAMVDPYSQWVLKPLHDLLFSLLRKIDSDGTFDQIKPVHRLLERHPKCLYSVDLSAATDRLPIRLQELILQNLFGDDRKFSELWSKLLVDRTYRLNKNSLFSISKTKHLRYAVGQPMGALSSWAMLALSHHVIVRMAALRAGIKQFTDYAVLGDDIVIANYIVYLNYIKIMKDELKVKIGAHKGIESPTGTSLEFAKKLFVNGLDLSPIAPKELIGSMMDPNVLMEMISKYKVSLKGFLRFCGYGYKARSLAVMNPRFDTLSGRLRSLLLLYLIRNSSLENLFDLISHAFADIDLRSILLSECSHLDNYLGQRNSNRFINNDNLGINNLLKQWAQNIDNDILDITDSPIMDRVSRWDDLISLPDYNDPEYPNQILTDADDLELGNKDPFSLKLQYIKILVSATTVYGRHLVDLRSAEHEAHDTLQALVRMLNSEVLTVLDQYTFELCVDYIYKIYNLIEEAPASDYQFRSSEGRTLSIHNMGSIRTFHRFKQFALEKGASLRLDNLSAFAEKYINVNNGENPYVIPTKAYTRV
jgi:hypothetical protein